MSKKSPKSSWFGEDSEEDVGEGLESMWRKAGEGVGVGLDGLRVWEVESSWMVVEEADEMDMVGIGFFSGLGDGRWLHWGGGCGDDVGRFIRGNFRWQFWAGNFWIAYQWELVLRVLKSLPLFRVF